MEDYDFFANHGTIKYPSYAFCPFCPYLKKPGAKGFCVRLSKIRAIFKHSISKIEITLFNQRRV